MDSEARPCPGASLSPAENLHLLAVPGAALPARCNHCVPANRFNAIWLADGWRSDERMVGGVFIPALESSSFFPGTGNGIAENRLRDPAVGTGGEAVADAEVDVDLADLEVGHRERLVRLLHKRGWQAGNRCRWILIVL